MSIITHVSVYENKNKHFTVDESAAIVLLEKSSNKLILTVPINSGLNKYSVLVQHYVFEDNLISLCDKSATEQVLASLSEKDASSVEDAEWRRDHYRLQDYLRSVSWQ